MRQAPSRQVPSPKSQVRTFRAWDLGLGSNRREAGQAMAEFALVLPILALLTFGTLEVALYLQQQSSMNAAAFVAARSASVLGGNDAAMKASLGEYTAAAGMPWLTGATLASVGRSGDRTVGYSLTAGASHMTGLISGLTQGQASGFNTLGASAVLPMEYNALKVSTNSSKSVTYKPKTISMIEYASTENAYKAVLSGNLLKIKDGLARLQEIREIIASVQKPTPTPSGPPKPNPKPNPNDPKPKPPAPKPSVVPVVPAKPDMSDVSKFTAMLNSAREPFNFRKPVVDNPRRRNDAGGDGNNEVFSQGYTGPHFEKGEDLKDRVAWKMSTIVKELRAYEDELGNGTANLENAARKTGQLAQPLKSNPLVAGALKKATGMVKEMNKSLDKPIADVKKNEESLFKRVPR